MERGRRVHVHDAEVLLADGGDSGAPSPGRRPGCAGWSGTPSPAGSVLDPMTSAPPGAWCGPARPRSARTNMSTPLD